MAVGVTPFAAYAGPFGISGSMSVSNTGAANYSIPIAVVPGSGGMTPQVSLHYSSQLPDGPFGVGWTSSVASNITRCPRILAVDGVKDSVNLDANDRFCLDGEQLLLVSGTYGQNGAEYRTEKQTFAKITSVGQSGNGPASFIVRTKGGLVHEYGAGPTVSLANTATYVEATGSQLKALPSASVPNTVILWSLNKTTDRAGNHMSYEYWNSWHVDPSTGTWFMRHVLTNIFYTGNAAHAGYFARVNLDYESRPMLEGWRDRSVTYVGGVALLSDLRVKSINSYYTPAGQSEALVRRYALSYDNGGTNFRSRLTGVQPCSAACSYSEPGDSGQNSTQDIPTRLTYFSGSVANLNTFSMPNALNYPQSTSFPTYPSYDYTGFEQLAADFNGDGRADIFWFHTGTGVRRLWTNVGSGNNGTGIIDNPGNAHGMLIGYRPLVIDANGDGNLDIVWHSRYATANCGDTPCSAVTAGAFVWLGDGTGGFPTILAQSVDMVAPQGISTVELRPLVGDFNGDGRDDILWDGLQASGGPGSNGVRVLWTSVGNGTFTPSSNFAGLDGQMYGWAPAVADFNGDGIADLFWTQVLTDGGSAGFRKAWITAAGGGSVSVWNNLNGADGQGVGLRYLVLDLNGDGRSDIFSYTADSYGRTTGSYAIWTPRGDGSFDSLSNPGSLGALYYPGRMPLVGDFDGDGFPDLLLDGRTVYGVSTGFGEFALGSGNLRSWKAITYAMATSYGQNVVPLLGDYDGDGKTDAFLDVKIPTAPLSANRGGLARNTFGLSGTTGPGGIMLNEAGALGVSDMLFRVVEGSGREHRFEYRPLSQPLPGGEFYWRVLAASYSFPYVDTTIPMQAVRFSATSTGRIDELRFTSYQYADAVFRVDGRGFLGFNYFLPYDLSTSIQTVRRTELQWPYTGMETLSQRRLLSGSGNTVLENVDRALSYKAQSLPNGKTSYWPFVSAEVVKRFDLATGSFLIKADTSSTYDDFGNLLSTSTQTGDAAGTPDGSWRASVNDYHPPDTSNWVIGLLKCSATQAGAPGFATQTRTASFEYDPTSRLLSRTINEPGTSCTGAPGASTDPKLRVITDHLRDEYGNIRSTTLSTPLAASDPVYFAPRTSTADYKGSGNSVRGRFTVSETNALGQTVTWARDAATALPLSRTFDGLTTTWAYSPLGRKKLETRPDGSTTSWTYTLCTVSLCGAGWETRGYVVDVSPAGGALTTTVYDSLDRAWRPWVRDWTNTTTDLRGGVDFDALGQVIRAYDGCRSGVPGCLYSTFAYDPVGRPATETDRAGKVTTYAYIGRVTRVTDPKGVIAEREVDGQGRVVRASQAVGTARANSIYFGYDPFGNTVGANIPNGPHRTNGYDVAGRRTSSSDPNLGTWSYIYDALGQLRSQTDAKGAVTTVGYDLLGRMSTKAIGGSNGDTLTYLYDQTASGCAAGGKVAGRLVQAATATGSVKRYCFDSLGRSAKVTHGVAPPAAPSQVDLSVSFAYGTYSRLISSTYAPSNVSLSYNYTSSGFMELIVDATSPTLWLWQALALDYSGRVTQERIGAVTNNGARPGFVATRSYGTRGTLDSQTARVVGADADFASQSYGYDDNLNVASRSWWAGGAMRTESFLHDELNRLTGISGASNKSFTYDLEGNLLTKDGNTYAYPSPGGVRPHGVSSIAGTINGVANPSYQYDGNGNLTAECPAGNCTSPTRTLAWTSDNYPSAISKGSTSLSFWYDADRARAAQMATVGGVTTRSFYGPGGAERVDTGGQADNKVYLNIEGRLIGTINKKAGGATEYRYFVTDHLGSPSMMLNETVGLQETEGFDAWGRRRNADGTDNPGATSAERRGYTTHEHLDTVGMVHMNGRVYDPSLGRFASADPIVQAPYDTQSYNRYSYVRNGPVSMTDPSGFFSLRKLFKGALIAVAAYYTAGAASSAYATSAATSAAAASGAAAGTAAYGAAYSAAYATAITSATAAMIGQASGGFTAGLLASGGSVKAGLYGAVGGTIGGAIAGTGAFGQMLGSGVNGYLQTGTVQGFGRGFAAGAIPQDLWFGDVYMKDAFANVAIGVARDGIRGSIAAGSLRGFREGVIYGQATSAFGHIYGAVSSYFEGPSFRDGAFYYQDTLDLGGRFGYRAIAFGNTITGTERLYAGALSTDYLKWLDRHERGHFEQARWMGATYLLLHAFSQGSGTHVFEYGPFHPLGYETEPR